MDISHGKYNLSVVFEKIKVTVCGIFKFMFSMPSMEGLPKGKKRDVSSGILQPTSPVLLRYFSGTSLYFSHTSVVLQILFEVHEVSLFLP
jgi:hypothetical protein